MKIFLFCQFICVGVVSSVPSEFWVDVNSGTDANPGTQHKPFKTITKARDTIRGIWNTTGIPEGGITVTIAPGDYDYTDGPLEFTYNDAGGPRSNINYRSADWKNGEVRLTAGKRINWSEHMSPVQDPVIRSLLKEPDKITQIDLKRIGVTDYGELQSGGLGTCANDKAELFTQLPNMTMVLARYPNIDASTGNWQWLSAGNVTDKQKSFNFNTDKDVATRILSWKNTSTLWLHGYWSRDWADNYVKVDNIQNNSFIISDKTPPLYGITANARYYALNILEELDTESEYYIDRGSGVLYLYESMARKLSAMNKGCISVGHDVLSFKNTSCIVLEGFTIDCARANGIVATDNAMYLAMFFMKVQDVGGQGILMEGYDQQLTNVSVTRTGCGGIHLSGGYQKYLASGNCWLTDSSVSDWSRWKRTYTPALSWGGVYNNYINNTFTNGPHAAILGAGNDNVFEGNTIDTVCYETSDSGGFYSGRSWIDSGNIIRGNTFRNIKNTEKTHLGYPSVQAIYLDDQMSGYTIENNVFINCHCGSFIGGGRRNTIRNNTYHNCSLCTHVDNRGMNWMKSYCVPNGTFEQELKSVNYQHPPWSTHYPELVNIMKDHPCVPVYNTIVDNKCCQSEKFIDVSDDDLKEWMITVKNNTVNC